MYQPMTRKPLPKWIQTAEVRVFKEIYREVALTDFAMKTCKKVEIHKKTFVNKLKTKDNNMMSPF